MFNKAKKEWKKALKEQKKEKGKHYHGWDIGDMGKESVTRDGVSYHINKPSKSVVDLYDEDIGSVEASHRESVGYAIVDGYSGNADTLDFTFIRPQDEVCIACDEKVKKIKVNAANLRYIAIKAKQPVHISIVKDTGLIDRKLGERAFKKVNSSIIKDVSYIEPDELESMLNDTSSKSEEKGKSK